MVSIRFTKHALKKFSVLKACGVLVSRAQVVHIIRTPDFVDYLRLPLYIAQGNFDKRRVLRVVYKNKGAIILVITFYPGLKSQYEKNNS
ncbi:MAG: DUF4258 domain-containing protein [bacterium]|nr:DUF4258 domain-containing protein [bacterium]